MSCGSSENIGVGAQGVPTAITRAGHVWPVVSRQASACSALRSCVACPSDLEGGLVHRYAYVPVALAGLALGKGVASTHTDGCRMLQDAAKAGGMAEPCAA